jgi:hypothetical protein
MHCTRSRVDSAKRIHQRASTACCVAHTFVFNQKQVLQIATDASMPSIDSRSPPWPSIEFTPSITPKTLAAVPTDTCLMIAKRTSLCSLSKSPKSLSALPVQVRSISTDRGSKQISVNIAVIDHNCAVQLRYEVSRIHGLAFLNASGNSSLSIRVECCG